MPASPLFPTLRMRRLRATPALREMVRETWLRPSQFILPLFVVPGEGVRDEISSMPGQYRWSVDRIAEPAAEAWELGVRSVILFGVPEHKDGRGSEADAADGRVQMGLQAIAEQVPDMVRVSDVCMCEYTDHGHCGILVGDPPDVDNDPTLQRLVDEALSHVRAGAQVIAPSDMMDGRVAAIRAGLDGAGFTHVPILSYAAKYTSGYYGPFRDAADSAPAFGDRSSYQMDPANAREALREVDGDIAEGADMIMVKPALAYLDVIRRVRERWNGPLFAYNVSGEYSMVKAAAQRGWIDGRRVALENLLSIVRAGADGILTYHAIEAARWLKEG
jgi:porphobilinogen synthase